MTKHEKLTLLVSLCALGVSGVHLFFDYIYVSQSLLVTPTNVDIDESSVEVTVRLFNDGTRPLTVSEASLFLSEEEQLDSYEGIDSQSLELDLGADDSSLVTLIGHFSRDPTQASIFSDECFRQTCTLYLGTSLKVLDADGNMRQPQFLIGELRLQQGAFRSLKSRDQPVDVLRR